MGAHASPFAELLVWRFASRGGFHLTLDQVSPDLAALFAPCVEGMVFRIFATATELRQEAAGLDKHVHAKACVAALRAMLPTELRQLVVHRALARAHLPPSAAEADDSRLLMSLALPWKLTARTSHVATVAIENVVAMSLRAACGHEAVHEADSSALAYLLQTSPPSEAEHRKVAAALSLVVASAPTRAGEGDEFVGGKSSVDQCDASGALSTCAGSCGGSRRAACTGARQTSQGSISASAELATCAARQASVEEGGAETAQAGSRVGVDADAAAHCNGGEAARCEIVSTSTPSCHGCMHARSELRMLSLALERATTRVGELTQEKKRLRHILQNLVEPWGALSGWVQWWGEPQ
jgi:hypothetical protein